MIRWNLTGTDAQQAIAREAFNRIKFPFDRLTKLPGTPELGWRDLNSRSALSTDVARNHGGHHGDEDRPDSLEGEMDGRRWVMGVIYTQSGRIYIDTRLADMPDLAMAVIGAEIAHAVDFFLPMTDDQRNELLRLWGKPNTTWWELVDYGAEYYRLGGEAFMHEFVAAYSDHLEFGNKSDFLHDVGVEPADVRHILGIERTDYVPPAPPPPPPVVEPEAPADNPSQFVHFPGGRDIYHKPTHYPNRGVPLETFDGFRGCKVCKP